MYEFYKHDGNLTEGYLGEPENFSGIVFLLKEPNNPGGATDFWFKEMLESTNKYQHETTVSKSVFTKFKNRFEEMIKTIKKSETIDAEKELKNSIFCNVNPVKGTTLASKDFYEILNSGKAEKMFEFFATLKNEITVFTCIDIYKYLLESEKIQNKIQEHGLTYTDKDEPLSCFKCEIGNTKVTVYEIIHPSRSSKILYK